MCNVLIIEKPVFSCSKPVVTHVSARAGNDRHRLLVQDDVPGGSNSAITALVRPGQCSRLHIERGLRPKVQVSGLEPWLALCICVQSALCEMLTRKGLYTHYLGGNPPLKSLLLTYMVTFDRQARFEGEIHTYMDTLTAL